jgi:putative membrane protein
MKGIAKNTIFNAMSLYILSQLISGVRITGGFQAVLLSGLILTILNIVLKPIISLFSMPLNMITLGLFSFITNAILLYILTIFVPNISVSSFTFHGYSFAGFIVPVIKFNTIYAFIVSAAVLNQHTHGQVAI